MLLLLIGTCAALAGIFCCVWGYWAWAGCVPVRARAAGHTLRPCAIDPLAMNVLLNPLQPDIGQISIKAVVPF